MDQSSNSSSSEYWMSASVPIWTYSYLIRFFGKKKSWKISKLPTQKQTQLCLDEISTCAILAIIIITQQQQQLLLFMSRRKQSNPKPLLLKRE